MQGPQEAPQDHQYDLFSVLMHRGEANSGHYWALVHDVEHARWLCFNDTKVSVVSLEDVLLCGAGQGKEHGAGANASFLVYVRCVVVCSNVCSNVHMAGGGCYVHRALIERH